MSWLNRFITTHWNDERFKDPVLVRIGSYALVYKCSDKGTDRSAAVKYIPILGGVGVPRHLRNRIEGDIDALHVLNHQNVVRREEGCVKLVMEFVDTDLDRYLKEVGPLDPNELKSFIFQILQGLSHIHSHGIVHCNVKPDNLLLDRDLQMIKITGFSHIRKLEDPPVASRITSHMYNPPEILQRRPEITTAADIWSLGCTFAEMIKGRRLFAAADLWSPGMNLAEFFPELEPNALDLLKRMLRFLPHERISVADALQHPYLHGVRPIV